MKGLWYAIYLVSLIFVCLLMPFAMFFYETDEDESFCRRFGKSILFTLAANIISILLLFITWNFFKFVDLPVYSVTGSEVTDLSAIDLNALTQAEVEKDLVLEASFAVYVIAIMSFFGWIFLVLFGGVGLFALPLDLVNEFRMRPQARKSDEMRQIKNNLVGAITSLIKEGEEVKDMDSDNAKNSEAGFFDRWSGSRQV